MRNGSTLIVAGPRRLGSTLPTTGNADADRWALTHTKEVAAPLCASGWRGKKGTDRNFPAWCAAWGMAPGAPAPTSNYPDYALADRNLQALIGRIQSCTASATTNVPSSWILPAPDGNAPASVVAAYNSYSLRLNSELPAAKQNAGVFCAAGAVSGGAGNPNAFSPYQQNCGYDVYGRPLPCTASGQPLQSAIVPGGDVYGSDPMAADIYTNTGGGTGYNPSMNFTDVVANPYAPPVQAPVEPTVTHPRRTASIAIGGVLLLAVGAFMLGKKRSPRRKS